MSEASNEPGGETDERAITDDQLPDDLNPEKNPLAAEPDESEDGGLSAPATGAGPDAGATG